MTAGAPPLDPYQLRLAGFEGPLDILLRLIERRELAITEVSLVAVTEQFLAYIDALDDRDPAVLAEFLTIGARLLLLKTRGLFPQAPAAPDDGDEDDPADLARQLREYQRFKEVALELEALDRSGQRSFEPARPPGFGQVAAGFTVAPARPADLLRAVRSQLARVAPLPGILELAPRVSVAEMTSRIIAALRLARAGVWFSDLARGVTHRGDVVTTFLALLELVRRRRADASQQAPFGDILVRQPAGSSGATEPPRA